MKNIEYDRNNNNINSAKKIGTRPLGKLQNKKKKNNEEKNNVATKSQIKAFEQGVFELTMQIVITGFEKKGLWMVNSKIFIISLWIPALCGLLSALQQNPWLSLWTIDAKKYLKKLKTFVNKSKGRTLVSDKNKVLIVSNSIPRVELWFFIQTVRLKGAKLSTPKKLLL